VIVQAAPWFHFNWLLERSGAVGSDGFKAIEALGPDGRIHGMVGFDGWTMNSVCMHIALDNPAAFRSLVHPIFEYAFHQCNRGIALCTVRSNNTRSLRLCERVGFREAYRVRDGFEVGIDLVLFEMRREECRWIQQRKAA